MKISPSCYTCPFYDHVDKECSNTDSPWLGKRRLGNRADGIQCPDHPDRKRELADYIAAAKEKP